MTMRNKIKQDFYLYYILENSNYNFLYKVRNCTRPQQTKEYKKLRAWMLRGTVYQVGYCTEEYYQDHNSKFIDPKYNILTIK